MEFLFDVNYFECIISSVRWSISQYVENRIVNCFRVLIFYFILGYGHTLLYFDFDVWTLLISLDNWFDEFYSKFAQFMSLGVYTLKSLIQWPFDSRVSSRTFFWWMINLSDSASVWSWNLLLLFLKVFSTAKSVTSFVWT